MTGRQMSDNRPSPASGRAEKGRAAPRKKGFNWAAFLIESAIAITVFNIIAGIATWYFILPRLKH